MEHSYTEHQQGYDTSARLIYGTPLCRLAAIWPEFSTDCGTATIDVAASQRGTTGLDRSRPQAKEPRFAGASGKADNSGEQYGFEIVEKLLPPLRTPLSAATKDILLGAYQLARSFRHNGLYTPHLIHACFSRNDSLGEQLRNVFALDVDDFSRLIQKRFTGSDFLSTVPTQLSDSLTQGLRTADALCETTQASYIMPAHLLQAVCTIQSPNKDAFGRLGMDAARLLQILRPYLLKAGFRTPDMNKTDFE